jgi:predicted NBD/HSP70 family sugar kinase
VQAAVSRAGDLAFTDSLPGWPVRGLRAHLEAELGMPVALENDVNLAAVAERAAGTAEGVDGFVLLWIGDGLGLALDMGGSVYRGARGGAGEIGYLASSSAADAPDLTALFGGAAVRALESEHGADAPRHLASRIALGLGPVLAVLDPERIVLGGPVGAAGGETLARLVAEELARTTRWSPDVVTTRAREHPVLDGARASLRTGIRDRLLAEAARLTPAEGSP